MFFYPFAPSPTADHDSFAFSIPTGTELTQIAYSFALNANLGTTFAAATFVLDNGNTFPGFPPLATVNVDLFGSNPVFVTGAPLPLGPGVYGLQNEFLSVGGPAFFTPGFSADYTWQFTVASEVPEPATVSSLGVGLVALCVVAAARLMRNAPTMSPNAATTAMKTGRNDIGP